ncbi:uncharacterized protein HMPREF1541_07347 [Cyphellophora europaea CBS 101466]|uniref:Restriction endonuclease type IV Mrr domain-containing protein n=1 Tax=Cyphellophora europaea (strain CBS 101466) TaxID=1220924 RepID=W2RPR6_CYPE1|nr:uncharacterized protein HMPREF1541_07347 [Cyphellophora europaea CBS 101466]ETN37724.1 hypothetical protein HMPREF1541_07347 [Cyphellophora europaea CBS 101466]
MLTRLSFHGLSSAYVVSRTRGASCVLHKLIGFNPTVSHPVRVQRSLGAGFSSLRNPESESVPHTADRPRDSLRHFNGVESDHQPSNSESNAFPPLTSLLPSNEQHSSLSTYISHAQRVKLNPATTTYTGTRYEYLAQDSLQRLGFELLRTGKTGDRGVDLAGWWHLPSPASGNENQQTERLKVVVQCKFVKGRQQSPSVVREMDGAFLGAPAGWRNGAVIGVVVSTRPATKGIISALGSSKRGMVWICMEEHEVPKHEEDLGAGNAELSLQQLSKEENGDQEPAVADQEKAAYHTVHGRVVQLLYNDAARRLALEGLDVLKRHGDQGNIDAAPSDGIALSYRGKGVPSVSVR